MALSTTSNVVPDKNSTSGKKIQVADMFNEIAPRYDFLNHTLSVGLDWLWRKVAIREVGNVSHITILDVATGTGDLAIAAAKLKPTKITGIDIASEMLEIGKKKIDKLKLSQTIQLQTGDCENLEFSDNYFDVVMCSYGIRNFENLETGLSEIYRVTRKGGKVVLLEFSTPEKFPFRQLYHFYFKHILPTIGKLISKHKTAYSYLPESVSVFPQGEAMCGILKKCGFINTRSKSLSFGVTTLYTANK